MITVRKYEEGDWQQITTPVEPFLPTDMPDMGDDSIKLTGVENGRVIGCGGVIFAGDEAILWLKLAAGTSIVSARVVKEIYSILKSSITDKIMTTYVLQDFAKGEKLASFLDMKQEPVTTTYDGRVYNKYVEVN